MFGMDMLLKSLGVSPEQFKETVTGLFQLGAQLKTQLDRIERNQAKMAVHLGIEIELPPAQIEHKEVA